MASSVSFKRQIQTQNKSSSRHRDVVRKASELILFASLSLVGVAPVVAQAEPGRTLEKFMSATADQPTTEKSAGLAPEAPTKLSVSRHRKPEELPFWKTKPEWRLRLLDGREVVVSVKTDKVKSQVTKGPAREEDRFTIKGAGVLAVPKDFAFRVAQEYSKLKRVSPHFKTVEYHALSRKLHLVTEALGWEARMVMRVLPVSSDWRDEIQWSVIWGDFKGMTGVIAVEPVGDGKRSEISIEALYQAESLPLPKVLMGIALETVVQKVAEKMRAFVESEYQAAGGQIAPASQRAPASKLPTQ